jgi:uncharacterized protein (TIGR02001 family)
VPGRVQLTAGLGAGALALAWAAPAAAQLSGSVGVVSDYRLRGVTLTDGRAAATLDVSYDHPSGAYAGATLVAEDLSDRGLRLLGHSEYVGFVVPTRRGPAIDMGLSNVDFDVYGYRRYLRYTEAYVGVVQGGFSAHLHYSPNYLRSGTDTLYAEVTGVARPAENWRVSAHAGLFTRLDSVGPDGKRRRYDVRVSATREFRNMELNVGWSKATPRPPGPSQPQPHGGFLVGATVFF